MSRKNYYVWVFNIVAIILSAVLIPNVWGKEPGLVFVWFFMWIIADFLLYGLSIILKEIRNKQ